MIAKSTTGGRGAFGFVSLLILGLALAHIRYLWFVCDDAYITYRYAANLAHGLGPVWNPGERVEGYTNFLWMLAASIVARFGGRPEAVLPVVSAACALVTLVAIGVALRQRGSAGNYAMALLALSSGFAAWATSGLETAAFTLFVTLGFLATSAALAPAHAGAEPAPADTRLLLLSAMCLALAALTRPEGVLVALSMSGFLAWRALRGALPWRLLGAWNALAGGAIGAHLLWRLSYYGRLLPNTAAVKSPGVSSLGLGAKYVLDAFLYQHLWLWLVPIVAAPFLAGRAREDAAGGTTLPPTERALALTILVPYLAYVCATGGDFMPLHRFIVPILPLLAILAGTAIDAIAGRPAAGRRAREVTRTLAAGGLVVLFAALDLAVSKREQESWTRGDLESVGLTRENAEHWGRVGKRLREITAPGDTLATTAAGIIPYETGQYTIDLLGLTAPDLSRYRARGIERAGHALYLDGAWLAAHPPQILLGHPEVRPTMTGLGLTVDLEPAERDAVLDHYGLLGMGLPGKPELYSAVAIRNDVLPRVEAAAKKPSAMR